MKVVLHDYKAGDMHSWARVINALARDARVDVVSFRTDMPSIDMVRQKCNGADTIVFLHSEQWEEWNAAQDDGVNPFQGILVHVGTNGFSGRPSSFENRRYASRYTAGLFKESGRGEAFFLSVAGGHPDWRLLNPPVTEDICALRILCEAWLTTKGGSKEAAELSLPIHTPSAPELWLRLSKDKAVEPMAREVRAAVSRGALTWPEHRIVVEKLRDALRAAAQ